MAIYFDQFTNKFFLQVLPRSHKPKDIFSNKVNSIQSILYNQSILEQLKKCKWNDFQYDKVICDYSQYLRIFKTVYDLEYNSLVCLIQEELFLDGNIAKYCKQKGRFIKMQ